MISGQRCFDAVFLFSVFLGVCLLLGHPFCFGSCHITCPHPGILNLRAEKHQSTDSLRWINLPFYPSPLSQAFSLFCITISISVSTHGIKKVWTSTFFLIFSLAFCLMAFLWLVKLKVKMTGRLPNESPYMHDRINIQTGFVSLQKKSLFCILGLDFLLFSPSSFDKQKRGRLEVALQPGD